MRSSLWIAAVMISVCVSLAGTQCKRQKEAPKPAPPKAEVSRPAPPVAETPEPQPAEVPAAESAQEIPSVLELVTRLQNKYKFPRTAHILKEVDVLGEDGIIKRERWEVWLQLPGRMRIDSLSTPGERYVSNFGTQVVVSPDGTGREFREPVYALLLMLDILVQPPEAWMERARRDGLDVDRVSVQPWHEAAGYYVIGEKPGRYEHPQVWLDRETLLPHLFLQRPPADEEKPPLMEGRASEYKEYPGGWTFPSVFEMYDRGRLVRTEVVKEIDFDDPLDGELFMLPKMGGVGPEHQKEVGQQPGSKETG